MKERVGDETNSGRDARITMVWILGVIGSISMLYYEYLWTRFALRDLASVSFGGWFTTSISIAIPWVFCLICLGQLRDAARNRSVGRDICLLIAMLVETVMVTAYTTLAPEIHRLTSLRALN